MRNEVSDNATQIETSVSNEDCGVSERPEMNRDKHGINESQDKVSDDCSNIKVIHKDTLFEKEIPKCASPVATTTDGILREKEELPIETEKEKGTKDKQDGMGLSLKSEKPVLNKSLDFPAALGETDSENEPSCSYWGCLDHSIEHGSPSPNRYLEEDYETIVHNFNNKTIELEKATICKLLYTCVNKFKSKFHKKELLNALDELTSKQQQLASEKKAKTHKLQRLRLEDKGDKDQPTEDSNRNNTHISTREFDSQSDESSIAVSEFSEDYQDIIHDFDDKCMEYASFYSFSDSDIISEEKDLKESTATMDVKRFEEDIEMAKDILKVDAEVELKIGADDEKCKVNSNKKYCGQKTKETILESNYAESISHIYCYPVTSDTPYPREFNPVTDIDGNESVPGVSRQTPEDNEGNSAGMESGVSKGKNCRSDLEEKEEQKIKEAVEKKKTETRENPQEKSPKRMWKVKWFHR